MYFRCINAYVISLSGKLTPGICVLMKLGLSIRGYIKVRFIRIPLKKVKVKLVFKIRFNLYLSSSFKYKFDRVNTSSSMFAGSIKYWKRVE